MTYELKFDIDRDLYKRASTQPFTVASKRAAKFRNIRNFLAVICFFAGIFLLGKALFPFSNPFAMICGAVVGAALVMVIWWRQHRNVVQHYSNYNETGGQQHMLISAKGVTASRPGITTQIDWDFVQSIWSIDDAVLIDLGTARLIIPNVALPENTDQTQFIKQLQSWHISA